MSERLRLQRRLAEVEAELAETRKRLPAHSAKPPVMMDLFALEDEQAAILQQLAQLDND